MYLLELTLSFFPESLYMYYIYSSRVNIILYINQSQRLIYTLTQFNVEDFPFIMKLHSGFSTFIPLVPHIFLNLCVWAVARHYSIETVEECMLHHKVKSVSSHFISINRDRSTNTDYTFFKRQAPEKIIGKVSSFVLLFQANTSLKKLQLP